MIHRPNPRLLIVPVLCLAAWGGAFVAPAQAASSSSPAYMVVDNNGSNRSVAAAPCSPSTSCATGIQFNWKAGACVNGDRYAPIVIVWLVNKKVAQNTWPVVVPCSTGIQLYWSTNNLLTKALWLGSSSSTYNLSVCWQAGQCNHSVCVTAGCLPQNVDGADIFFQGGDSLTSANWRKSGATVGTVKPSTPVDDVYWTAGTPPASPFAGAPRTPASGARHSTVAAPKVVLLGRDSTNGPETTTNSAPAAANDVNFQWSLAPSGSVKQCTNAAGYNWTNPLVTYAYMTRQALNARVSALTCPKSAGGTTLFFNGIDYRWQLAANGTTYLLWAAVPTFNGSPASGIAPSAIPQPPTGTDEVILGFHHDDFSNAWWTQNQTVLNPALTKPGHSRMGTWTG